MTFMSARYGMILAACLLATPASSLSASGPERIAETENFAAICNTAGKCRSEAAPGVPGQVQRALIFLEDARTWLSALGFPVNESHLDSSKVDAKQFSWTPIPAIAKEMLLRKLASRNPAMEALGSGSEGEQGVFFARMPLAFSERFAWDELRDARGSDGGPPSRTSAPCPNGAKGCSETTILMDGQRVPVLHDPQGRPLTVTFRGEAMELDYGSWPIRRPPGW